MTGKVATGGDNKVVQKDARRLLLWPCSGTLDHVEQPLTLAPGTRAVWIGEDAQFNLPTITPRQTRKLLGAEFDLVIYDARQGVEPDALGIAAGCIPAGGSVILRLPDRHCESTPWQTPYHRRFRRLLLSCPAIEWLESPGEFVASPALATKAPAAGWISDEQAAAVDAIVHVLSGRRKRPAILVADRGRGKSAALGIAAARILMNPDRRIVVSGRSRASANVVFRHGAAGGESVKSRLQWMEIDDLLRQGTDADMVMIDEAAGVPLHQLEAVLARFSRVAMATTVHGYEGSGRGFLLRFRQSLDRLTRGWRKIGLQTPIRWNPDDPLESWVDRSLLLSARLAELDTEQNGREIRVLSGPGADLADDDGELTTVFSLLVAAHYRTRPSDLRQLLDNEQAVVYRLQTGAGGVFRTVAVLLAITEPAPSAPMREAIRHGKRRPPGFVVAELLAGQMGIESALALNFLRIQRIVVHPALRRCGLGTALLQHCFDDHKGRHNLVGTNFSVDPGIVTFWRNAGFAPVRLGSRHTSGSGAVSGLFLRPLDDPGQSVTKEAIKSFAREFPASLPRTHRHLDPEIIHALIWRNPCFDRSLTPSERQMLERFTAGLLPAEAIPCTLIKAVLTGLARGTTRDSLPGIEYLLQGRPWDACRSLSGDEGRRGGVARLQQTCRDLLETEQPCYTPAD